MSNDPVQRAIEEARLRSQTVAPPAAPSVFVPPAGWTPHPDAAGYYYQGNEVLNEEQLKARFPSVPAAPPVPPAAPQAPKAYVPPTTANVPATTQAGGAVAAYDSATFKAGRKMSMADMNAGRSKLNVETFLKVDENGIKASFLRDDPRSVTLGNKLGHKLKVKVNFDTDIRLCFAIRFQDPIKKEVKYFRTGDRVMSDDGQAWTTCLAIAKQTDPQSKGDYPSVDLSGQLVDSFRGIDGAEILPAGTVIGFSTAVMNFKAFDRLMTELLAAGAIEANTVDDDTVYTGEVYIEIGFKPMVNKNNQQYGIFTFTYAGNVGEDEDVGGEETGAPAVPNTPAAPEAPAATKSKRSKKAADPAAIDGEVLPPVSSAPAAPPAAPPVVPPAAPPAPPAVFPPEGWIKHPTADGYYYKGDKVLTEEELRKLA